MEPMTKGFIEIMAAEQSMDDTDWFQGTADAVRRCLKHFGNPAIKYIFVLSGDQLYKMDLGEIYLRHLERKAEITLACNEVPSDKVKELGILGVDGDLRINKFVEKPKDISEIKGLSVKVGGKEKYLGSMGIYLFNKSALMDILSKDNRADFGREIIPDVIHERDAYAHVFSGYWRDIGTIKNFYEENLSLTDPMPPLDMFEEKWQIFTRTRYLPPAKFEDSHIQNSIVAEGAIVLSATIKHSIIGLRFRVDKDSVIEDTVAMGCDYYETVDEMEKNAADNIPPLGIGKNCIIRKAIIDKDARIGNNVKIINKDGLTDHDGPNYYIRDGIVIIGKKSVIPSGTVI